MNLLTKSLSLAVLLTLCLALLFSQVFEVQATGFSAKEKALTFLSAVAGLDMAKYDVTLVSDNVIYPPGSGGIAQEDVHYVLEASGSKLDIMCAFRNESLYYCHLGVIAGSPLSTQPATDVLNSAKNLIQRYQANFGDSYLQPMKEMLNSVTEVRPLNATSGNIKFTISTSEDALTFKWMYTFAGLDNAWKAFGFTFYNGYLVSLGDGWNLYQMGSTDVKVSKENAIDIAMERANNYTLRMYAGPNGTLIDVPFRIAENRTMAELSIQPREPLILHPFWHIQLYFDKVYYSAYGIEVGVWADTGEVEYCQATGIAGYMGDSSTPPSVSPSTSNTQTNPSSSQPQAPAGPTPTTSPPDELPNETTPKESTSIQSINTYIAVAVATISIPVAVAAIALKKKRSK